MALVQSNFLQNRKNRPKTAEIDVIQWDKYWKKENNSDSESNSNNIDELGNNLDESDEDLEIVSIRPTFVQKLDDALKRSSESQTDPVQVRISEVLGLTIYRNRKIKKYIQDPPTHIDAFQTNIFS